MPGRINIKTAGLYLGPILFFVYLSLPPPGGMEPAASKTLAVTLLMITWWITEAIPIAATSLLPVVLFPVLGVIPVQEASSPYANPLIFLFLGGFIIASAMQRWDLHHRIALRIIVFAGIKPLSIIKGFIAASAFLSMWVSNTATAMMMLPIAVSVLHLSAKEGMGSQPVRNFEITLVLSIAYSCSIGGLATLIGTPPNALFAAFMLENYGIEVSFARWILIGFPLVVILLPLMYFILTRIVFPVNLKELPGGKALIQEKAAGLGRITRPEKRVSMVFGITACLWIFRPFLVKILPGLSDSVIAVAGALFLFITPSGTGSGERLLSWPDLKGLPWGILLLFGGGLSLATAITSSGLAVYIGDLLKVIGSANMFILILAVVLVTIFFTEITSNTALASAFLPILASMATGLGQNPMLFALPAAIAASCAFMLPVATPPNAIVYGTGRVTIYQMAKGGLWLNLIFSVAITLAHYFLFARVFGIEIL